MHGMLLSAGGETTTTYIQQAVADVDFMSVLTEIISVAPVILPTVVAALAFRKALSWVMRLVRRM